VEFWCKKPNFLEFTWATHVGVKVWWKGPEAAVFGHGPGGVKNRPVPTRIPALVPSLHLLTSARLPLKKVRFYVFTVRHLCLRGTYLYPHGCDSANSLVSATETTGSGFAKSCGEVAWSDTSQFKSGVGMARIARLRRTIKCSALQRQTQYLSMHFSTSEQLCSVSYPLIPAQ
jgi:hypothetical protein